MTRTAAVMAVVAMVGCAPDPVEVSGVVVSLGLGGAPIPGAEVCFEDQCTTADDDGEYALSDLPARTEAVVRLTAENHVPARSDLTTLDADYPGLQAGLAAELFWTAQLDAQDEPQQAGTGSLAVWTIDRQSTAEHERLAGFAVELDADGASGPLYDGDGTYVQPGDATGDSGLTVYYNIPPGTYDLTITQAGWSCAPQELLRTADGAMQVTVEADWVTYFVAICSQ